MVDVLWVTRITKPNPQSLVSDEHITEVGNRNSKPGNGPGKRSSPALDAKSTTSLEVASIRAMASARMFRRRLRWLVASPHLLDLCVKATGTTTCCSLDSMPIVMRRKDSWPGMSRPSTRFLCDTSLGYRAQGTGMTGLRVRRERQRAPKTRPLSAFASLYRRLRCRPHGGQIFRKPKGAVGRTRLQRVAAGGLRPRQPLRLRKQDALHMRSTALSAVRSLPPCRGKRSPNSRMSGRAVSAGAPTPHPAALKAHPRVFARGQALLPAEKAQASPRRGLWPARGGDRARVVRLWRSATASSQDMIASP